MNLGKDPFKREMPRVGRARKATTKQAAHSLRREVGCRQAAASTSSHAEKSMCTVNTSEASASLHFRPRRPWLWVTCVSEGFSLAPAKWVGTSCAPAHIRCTLQSCSMHVPCLDARHAPERGSLQYLIPPISSRLSALGVITSCPLGLACCTRPCTAPLQYIPTVQAIASMEPGLYFGGGKEVMGEGELQSCLRVLATTEVEAYHCHIHTFFKFATPDMVRWVCRAGVGVGAGT